MFARLPCLEFLIEIEPENARVGEPRLAEIGAGQHVADDAHRAGGASFVMRVRKTRPAPTLAQIRPKHRVLATDARLLHRAERPPFVAILRLVIARLLVVADL